MRRPLKIFLAHPLHSNRLPDRLRQNDRFVFGSGISAVRAAIMSGSGERANHNLSTESREHVRYPGAQRLRVLRVRVDVHGPIGTNVGDRHRRPDRRVLQEGTLVPGRKLLGRTRKCGSHVAARLLTRLDGSRFPIRILFQKLEEPRVAGKSLPLRPLCACSNLLRRFDGLPFRGSNDPDQIAFDDNLRIRETRLVQSACGNQFRPERFGMHHTAHAACREDGRR